MASSPHECFRYERKYQVDGLDVHAVRQLVKLHPAMFVQPYPPRFINNLYFDTQDFRHYMDNVSGVGDREKVRVRWYGALFGGIDAPVLQFKIKRGLVGTKKQYPLAPFRLERGFSTPGFAAHWRNAALPDEVIPRLHGMTPVLVNRYYRWYYATLDGSYRITVDADVTYYRVGSLRSTFAHRQVDRANVIVELKYGPEHAGGASRVSSYFPFRMTRNSKYVQGIERVHW